MSVLKAICFGEILYDNFPTYSRIGGAPLNVASRLQSYGVEVGIISAVGNDNNGKKLLGYLKGIGVDTSSIEINDQFRTGEVNVVLNDKGIASYDIAYPVAWDKVPLSKKGLDQVKKSDIFIFGSLACRDGQSRSTLKALMTVAEYKVFDVNLRVPHYTRDIIVDLLMKSSFVKFNDDELFEVAGYLDIKFNSMERTIARLSLLTNTETICVTKGAYGAVIYHKGAFYYNSGYRVKVVDTVGSGDSFLASVLYKLLSGEGPQKAIDFGCAVGAMVARSEGANPIFTRKKISSFMNS
ncbi:MAG TPA: carbohydrate kinase [Muricauda sp.]|nr:carbohydrate kinase [uncultured Allomuricauda sp.]MBC74063.1 carbohydrate kinase [Allomuricauda sp.]HBU77409.1 carbohydrate kinase [Allomuricauda sp.]|tara:strand:- start:4971 stop:5858 length:888 start_codon:yes stop_codon:yes gene_type:complete